MNTKDFIHAIKTNSGQPLEFELPDGTLLGGDLHITEIKHQDITSVDCGGNAHSFRETVVQLWINEDSDRHASWTTDKALSIIKKVGEVQPYTDEAEVFIEFGNSTHPTIKYSVDINSSPDKLSVKLKVKPTACKPKLAGLNQLACC